MDGSNVLVAEQQLRFPPYKYTCSAFSRISFSISHPFSKATVAPSNPANYKKNLSFSPLSPFFSILSKMPSQPASVFLLANRGRPWLQDSSACYNAVTINGQRLAELRSVFPRSPALISSVQDLFEFICAGPLMKKMGMTQEIVAATIDRWLECGLHLCRLFGLNELNLTTSQKARFYHYYIPVFLWCEDQILHHRSNFQDGDEIPPLVIGVSAPQGCGKTTLVFALDYLFRVTGRKSATISIDDFYLTAEDQDKVRSENPGNSLLELRGNAGTHDLPFSVDILTGLTKLTKDGMKMKLPRYDKSAHGGRGDRADPSTWPEVEGPLEVVLFEGWMLGFKTLPNKVVKAVDPQLEIINKKLKAYYDAWDKFVQSWIIIKIKDPSCVFQWRLQAEVAMRAEGKPGMSDEEVCFFIHHFLLPSFNLASYPLIICTWADVITILSTMADFNLDSKPDL
ncbi:D-glycerate 3-kinase, chloroplastic-like isoform X2 [Magnolia sinica]|uniref:D-glycerate 3-kinase, chloroplastic-like isoform X2 n=1 Tax=Magnolia sinica TaxID=86752 RepID=UPI002659E8BA|nr:D-glycerate 3-kinase, chloroplastic-like isoform X2 [Magnolia sinica]